MSPTSTIFSVATAVLGPLTTTFTPPPACATAVAAIEGKFLGMGGHVGNSGWLGQACSKGKPADDTSCWPPTSSGAESRSKALDGWGYYSPGLYCPVGYATACSATAGGKSNFDFQFAPGAKETAAGCCPKGYECASVDNGQTCVMAATSTDVEYVTCDKSDMDDLETMAIPDKKEKTTAFMFYAPMIQINWQESDRPTETLASRTQTLSIDVETLSTLATAGEAPSGVSSRMAFPTVSMSSEDGDLKYSDDPDSEASTGNKEGSDQPKPLSLSTGVKVGMGVAGGVLAVAIVAIIFICAWRKRKNEKEEEEFDRMYGMKNVGSSTADLRHEEIPGWHRGPLYIQLHTHRNDTMSTESTRPLLLPQNRKLRHLRGIYLRNLNFTRTRGRTIDDAALNKTPGKLEALRQRPDLHHTLSSEDLRPPTIRRRSTLLVNADPATRQKSYEDTFASKLADAFFTLHVDGLEDPIYISEVAERATNFNFRLFELADLDSTIAQSPQVTVRVWAKRQDQWLLLLEDDVDLRTLNWLGTLQNVHFPANSLVFHMIDGIYSLELSNKYPPPKKEVAPLPTSSYNVLMRLATLNNSVQDALATRDALAAQINDLLAQEESKHQEDGNLAEAEEKVKLATKYLTQQKRAVAAARKRNEEMRASIAARKAAIESGLAVQEKAEEDVRHAAGEPLTQSKTLLSSVRDQIRGQRRRICEDLLTIYRISPLPPPVDTQGVKNHDPLSFQICSLPLANTVLDPTTSYSPTFTHSGNPKEKYPHEETLSASLSLVALLVHHLQHYLSVPLPYPIKWHGSRSTIRDDISNFPVNPNASSFSSHASQSSRSTPSSSSSTGEGSDPNREFPLFLPKGGSTAQYRFEYAWFLLNRDIEVLCYSQGLKVVDIRHTLPNLQWLLMGVRFGDGLGSEVDGSAEGSLDGRGSGSVEGSQAGSVAGDERSRDGGSRRGSVDSDATVTSNTPRTRTGGGLTIGNGNGTKSTNGLPPPRSLSRSPLAQLPFDDEGSNKLTLRTKGLRESAAR
ncbi:UV radiation resistance protein and autophagy-related subunit 14-domain-containing protein [Sordaria brevicollis]|uniref:Autophagy-related protein 14 n=1 Tax=Sordaria brevicollis TaxID=83679 RepID=A0AAE0P9H9_SORBR|nr:UV radiation resistance protein and autophagy-related subunit 14-domain-containing protein [Sordaria brevicollis]